MVDAIYIHIPFCLKKCDYCDFISFSSTKEKMKEYVNYLIKEIELYPEYEYDTVYFGGGTPSILEIEDLERVLKKLKIKNDAEITIEVNPKTVDLEKLKRLKAIGFNRLSIGIQSFNKKFLKILGRAHTSIDGIKTYLNARKAGFKNISLDLMFSLPTQTLDDVKQDLDLLFKLKPEHFSIYSLIWEEGTVFFEKLEKNIFKETENEVEGMMYEMIIDMSKKNGYTHYEISNFSLPNMESRHNTKYWENKQYLGIGLGASGYINKIRYKNEVQFSKYYAKIKNKVFPFLEKEGITSENYEKYTYMLGFRLLEKGVKVSDNYLETVLKLTGKGLVFEKNGKYLLTKNGIMLANDVISEFI